MEKNPADINIAGSYDAARARISEALRQPVYIDPNPKPDPHVAELLQDPEAYFASASEAAETAAQAVVAEHRAGRLHEQRRTPWGRFMQWLIRDAE